MKWRKLGLVYAPTGERWWARQYAILPTADVISEDRIRVYYASLDEHKHGRVGYLDVDAQEPCRILANPDEPVLDIGEAGAFDDSGVNPSCIVNVDGLKYMYYIGWQRCDRVPYMLYGGVATSTDGGSSFQKTQQVPVLDRTNAEPYSRGAPFVLQEHGVFKAWYWSCTHWSETERGVHYNNLIRYAESDDGIHWEAHEQPCVAPEGPSDYSVGRPWVIREKGLYRMWYSIRSHTEPYRMGYAESTDGLSWRRKDNEVGIEVSADGWDSEMICYPCVVDAGGQRYMFYNGNQHGATGFGCAVQGG